jgi:hypothetical protein
MIKFSFDSSTPVTGGACTVIEANPKDVFEFIADDFFDNYRKWAPEVIELEAIEGNKVCVGAKGRQVRQDVDSVVESSFEIVEYSPHKSFVFQGISPPYKNTYLTESHENGKQTRLTFQFDLLEIDVFMRPFVKLIRIAIEDGAEATVEKIKQLVDSKHAEST